VGCFAGFPSDGIVQVEEEEEENDSDNNTYTIENDVRQRRQARELQRKKIKSKQQTFPRSKEAKGTHSHYTQHCCHLKILD
jgi:hypothetical protein